MLNRIVHKRQCSYLNTGPPPPRYGTYSIFHLLALQRNRTEVRLLMCNTRAIPLSHHKTIRCKKLECLDFETFL